MAPAVPVFPISPTPLTPSAGQDVGIAFASALIVAPEQPAIARHDASVSGPEQRRALVAHSSSDLSAYTFDRLAKAVRELLDRAVAAGEIQLASACASAAIM